SCDRADCYTIITRGCVVTDLDIRAVVGAINDTSPGSDAIAVIVYDGVLNESRLDVVAGGTEGAANDVNPARTARQTVVRDCVVPHGDIDMVVGRSLKRTSGGADTAAIVVRHRVIEDLNGDLIVGR